MIQTIRKFWHEAAGLIRSIPKLWTPIFINEGECIPKWYGCSHWIPFELSRKEPEPGIGVWEWRRVYYPIPANLLLAAYYWSRYMVKVGAAPRPQHYTSRIFEIKRHCPHCGEDLNSSPTP